MKDPIDEANKIVREMRRALRNKDKEGRKFSRGPRDYNEVVLGRIDQLIFLLKTLLCDVTDDNYKHWSMALRGLRKLRKATKAEIDNNKSSS